MFHLSAYAETQDTGGVLTNVAALADPSLTVSGDNIQVPDFGPMLLGAFGLSAGISRCQLQAPSLRRVINQEITALFPALKATTITYPFLFPQSPTPLDINEQLQALVAETTAGAELSTVLVWLCDKPIEPVAGDIYSIRVTAAQTLVAGQWTNGALVFDQVLPVGKYAVVGAVFTGATLQAFRFVFQSQANRPGGLGMAAVTGFTVPQFRQGALGVWGEFMSTNPPTVDFLATAADAAQTGVIDVIKTG